MLSVRKVYKSYGGLPVLKGVDLEVAAGEIISIVGASGAGKSTLLHIIGTLDTPDAGEVAIAGKNLSGLSPRMLSRVRNEKIGFIFQFHHLLPEFTALENVCIPAYIKKVEKKQAENRATELLSLLGVGARADHRPSQMSGGEQQRVAVARALMNSPLLVLADEPSGNLDSKSAEELHELFLELRKQFNQTFIIVTHNKELAGLADRQLSMKDGKIETTDRTV